MDKVSNKIVLVHATTSLLFERSDQVPKEIKSLGQLVDEGFMPLTGEAREGFSPFNGISQDRICCFKFFMNSSWNFYMNMIYQRGHSGNINLNFYLNELDEVLDEVDPNKELGLWKAQQILIWGLRVAELSKKEFDLRKEKIQKLDALLYREIEKQKKVLDKYRLVALDNSKYKTADEIAQFLTSRKAQPLNQFPIDAPSFNETQIWFNHFRGNLHYRFDYWYPHYLEQNFQEFQDSKFQKKFLKTLDKYHKQLDLFYTRFTNFSQRKNIDPIYEDVDFAKVYPILLIGEFDQNDSKYDIYNIDNQGESFIKGPVSLESDGFNMILCHPEFKTDVQNLLEINGIKIKIGNESDYLKLLENMAYQELQYFSEKENWDKEKFNQEVKEMRDSISNHSPNEEKQLLENWFKSIEVRN